MSQTSRKSSTKPPREFDPIAAIAAAQLEAQGCTEVKEYRAAARERDRLIAGLSDRQRANGKLCYGVLDRLLNPVTV
jgi:hypothetical protein